jgi:type IV secretory pathway TrbD component
VQTNVDWKGFGWAGRVGWAILRVVALVPILGGLVWFAAAVFGLGVLVVAIWRGRSAARARPGRRLSRLPRSKA